jgi:hypothetical protein
MWRATSEDDWNDLAETFPYLGRLLSRVRRMRDSGVVGDDESADCPVDLQTAIMPAKDVVVSLDEHIKRKPIGTRHAGSELP